MHIDGTTGILAEADFIPSPNFDDRPAECDINLLVIHNISLPPNQFGGPYIQQLFTNQLNPAEHPFFKEICHLKVSAHLLIRRDGSIIQFVPFNKRAWHAGVSEFDGQTCCNDFSIGIELEGTDEIEYEDIQYQTLADVTAEIIRVYPGIMRQRITGHCDIAPDRKTDPGPVFAWKKYLDLVFSS